MKEDRMGNKRFRYVVPVVLALSLAGASLAIAASQGPANKGGKKNNGRSNTFHATLSGHNEVPAIHTGGSGHLMLTVNNDNTLSFELTYSGLSSPVQAAHVHFAQPNVNGGVSFFFCGGAKPACPAGNTSTPATVTGTVAAGDILAIPTQGLAAGDLAAIVSEIKDGFTYVNVHTTSFGGGEIRGQLGSDRGKHGGHDRGHKR
jgi:hypothetical protein